MRSVCIGCQRRVWCLCGVEFSMEGNRKTHRMSCTGGGMRENSRQCGRCDSWVSRGNYARHVRRCRGGLGDIDEEVEVGDRTGEAPRGRRGPCPRCGTELLVANMARHLRRCRLVWDPGGEPRP